MYENADGTHSHESATVRAIDEANALIDMKSKSNEEFTLQTANLPLLSAGQELKSSDIGMGFRVLDGYGVYFGSRGGVRISETRDSDYNADKIRVFVMKYPHGLAWVYWSDLKFGENDHTLEHCVVNFGMGGWVRNGLQAKVIFLDETRSLRNCFTMALTKDGNQIMSKSNEENAMVYRVFRSEVPEHLQRTIALRELLSIRQKVDEARWWYV